MLNYKNLVRVLAPNPTVFAICSKYCALVLYYSEGAAGAAVAAGAAFLCTTNRGKLLQHQLIRVQCTKKVPGYRSPLYRSMGIWFKTLFLSIVFSILKKSYF